MEDFLKNIIREEMGQIMSKKYSENEVGEAINKKSFVHTRSGKVYSPVMLKKGFFTGVDNEGEHVDITLDEIVLIQSKEDRFKLNK